MPMLWSFQGVIGYLGCSVQIQNQIQEKNHENDMKTEVI